MLSLLLLRADGGISAVAHDTLARLLARDYRGIKRHPYAGRRLWIQDPEFPAVLPPLRLR